MLIFVANRKNLFSKFYIHTKKLCEVAADELRLRLRLRLKISAAWRGLVETLSLLIDIKLKQISNAQKKN